MSTIVFFCIPAYGHTNPTLGVVRELAARGHKVVYYSYDTMRKPIEAQGAAFVSCNAYDAEQRLSPKDGERLGRDLAFSTQVLVDTTLALDNAILSDHARACAGLHRRGFYGALGQAHRQKAGHSVRVLHNDVRLQPLFRENHEAKPRSALWHARLHAENR